MPEESQYSSDLAEKIFFDPIKEGADRLCILTERATPSMASWLLKSFEERGIEDVRVDLIIGNVLDEGIQEAEHESFKELHANRYLNESGNEFQCSYLFQSPLPKKQNYYIWMEDETPVKAFCGSYEFTQKAILRRRVNVKHFFTL